MLKKIALSLSVATFGLVVPLLEINTTHVFNPLWHGHARLHEVWQLGTNSMIALVCLWLAWRRADIRSAAALGLIVVLGFLAAFVLGPTYGGSMRHADGSELTIAGVNAAVIVMVAAAAVLGLLWARPAAPRRLR
jgi:beta-lactamase regulating signal transducer with metallopeptidase domain